MKKLKNQLIREQSIIMESSGGMLDTLCLSTWLKLSRFCQIRYFFQDKHFYKFHGLWFLHGSRTLLQETAHSNSLYLLNQCADIGVETIYQKANFSILKPSDQEQEDTSDPDLNNFHCG